MREVRNSLGDRDGIADATGYLAHLIGTTLPYGTPPIRHAPLFLVQAGEACPHGEKYLAPLPMAIPRPNTTLFAILLSSA